MPDDSQPFSKHTYLLLFCVCNSNMMPQKLKKNRLPMKYYFNCGVPQRISTMYISFNPTSSICTDSLIVMMLTAAMQHDFGQCYVQSTVMTGGQAVLSKLSALKLDVGVSGHSPSSSTSFCIFENKSPIVS